MWGSGTFGSFTLREWCGTFLLNFLDVVLQYYISTFISDTKNLNL